MFLQLTDNVAVSRTSIKYCIVLDDTPIGFADTYNEALEVLEDLSLSLESDLRRNERNDSKVFREKRDGRVYILYQKLGYLSNSDLIVKNVLYITSAPRYIVRPRMPNPFTPEVHIDLEKRIKKTQ